MSVIDYVASIVSGARFSKFFGAGVSGAVVDNISLVVFVEYLIIDPLPAKILAAEVSIIVMFCINEQWTFRHYGSTGVTAIIKRFIKSNFVRVGGVLVALGTLFLLHNRFGVWYLPANIVGIGLGFIVNYISENLITWRTHK